MQPSLAKWTVWRWMNLRAYLRHLLHWQSRSHRSHRPGHQALCNTGVLQTLKMSLQGRWVYRVPYDNNGWWGDNWLSLNILTTILLSQLMIYKTRQSFLRLPLWALSVLVSECCPLCPRGCDPSLEAGIMSVIVSSLGPWRRIDGLYCNLVLIKHIFSSRFECSKYLLPR